jgi:2-haloacid dehalogenase
MEQGMAVRLDGVNACVFDAYGTLFDVASACLRCEDALGEKAAALAALWRDKQLQYTWLRTIEGRHADFWQVTGDALDYAMDDLQVSGPGLRDRLMDLYRCLDVFPEVPGVLRKLREAGFATAILSNGSPRMLAAAVENAGIGRFLTEVLSVEDVGAFKPHPKVYQYAVDRLGVAPGQICFQSSNAWDAYAASAFGMRVIWCNRYAKRRERLPGSPDAEIRTLAELPSLLALG